MKASRPDPPEIFISYSRADREKVNDLCRALTEAGYGYWLDSDSLVGGTDWESSIRDAIESSDIFLAVVSQSSIESSYVKAEVNMALLHRKPIIPVIIDEAEPWQLHSSLSLLATVNVFANPFTGYQRLLAALRFADERQTSFMGEPIILRLENYRKNNLENPRERELSETGVEPTPDVLGPVRDEDRPVRNSRYWKQDAGGKKIPKSA